MKKSNDRSALCCAFIIALTCCVYTGVLTGCNADLCDLFTPEHRPAWSASAPVLHAAPVAGRYHTGAVRFTLHNNADQAIQSMHIRFGLFDRSSGVSAIPGTGLLDAFSSQVIESGSACELEISLDPWLHQYADPSWIIDYLHFPEIRYSNGSRWLDPFAVWRLRSRED